LPAESSACPVLEGIVAERDGQYHQHRQAALAGAGFLIKIAPLVLRYA
jgi:hypothetical protein